ncbi:hypothetical protein PARPLA_02231 [Rhodobacteraceae bacterium THAF1]|uniref:hypothetical protein n=1 Tax=Palleronia sp. THAF1 TaxID=2587842 RepID=UPI000F3D2EA8|nr:hypothetical protein [Palleronia sp. THAF1]QFU07941.1 hypothetical protein FIU81_04560 [Palleronia sp. THAF1]VDC25775.1 hypothetical protein PARPLA_02231 [Rhodobacteraceae bacterium THAF1]
MQPTITNFSHVKPDTATIFSDWSRSHTKASSAFSITADQLQPFTTIDAQDIGSVLEEASRAELNATAVSDTARELISMMLDRTIEFELENKLKSRKPKPKDREGLYRTIESFTCDLILGQGHIASAGFIFRPVGRNFEPTRTTKKLFERIRRTWQVMGLIEERPGFQYTEDFEGPTDQIIKRATRFRATPQLVRLCRESDITPQTLWDHYDVEPSDFDSLVVKTSDGILIHRTSAEHRRHKEIVDRLNFDLSQHTFSFARRPQLRRVFRANGDGKCDYKTGGRFFALGADSYQKLSSSERAKIIIDGEATVEVDVKASHPTIIHHLLGVNEPLPSDPYAIEGYRRKVIKAAMLVALGKCGPPKRWKPETKSELAECYDGHRTQVPPVTEVWVAIVEALPFLERLEESTTGWGIVQYLEAEALLKAMQNLWEQGIPSLPVHDSLIVPRSAFAVAKDAIINAFENIIGVSPKVV